MTRKLVSIREAVVPPVIGVVEQVESISLVDSEPVSLSAPTLNTLPEELILRILSCAGSSRDEMRLAFVLGAVCTRLRRILTGTYLPSLGELNKGQLEALTLSDPPSARRALKYMLQRAVSLRRVYLSGFAPEVFTPTCFASMAIAAGNNLRIVDLAYSCVTDDAVRPLMRCPVLEELSLYGCSKINGSAFGEPNRQAPMHILDLSFVHGLSHESLKLVSRLNTTEHLKLMGCNVLNHAGMTMLANGPIAKSLKSIALNFCPIDDRCLTSFIEAAPKLTKLTLAKHTENLWDTGQYTQLTIDNLSARFRNLKIIIEN